MRTKFKILMCALFLLGLAVSQVHAQYAFRLGARTRTVAQYGHNQMVGSVYLVNVVNPSWGEYTMSLVTKKSTTTKSTCLSVVSPSPILVHHAEYVVRILRGCKFYGGACDRRHD